MKTRRRFGGVVPVFLPPVLSGYQMNYDVANLGSDNFYFNSNGNLINGTKDTSDYWNRVIGREDYVIQRLNEGHPRSVESGYVWHDVVLNDVNAYGQAVGTIHFDQGNFYSFFIDHNLLSVFGVRELFAACAINNLGQIIGYNLDEGQLGITDIYDMADYRSGDSPVKIKYLYPNAFPGQTGWTMIGRPTNINDIGQIIGKGTYKGKQRTYLASPIAPIFTPLNLDFTSGSWQCSTPEKLVSVEKSD